MDIKETLLNERSELMNSVDKRRVDLQELQTAAPDDGDSAQQAEERDQIHREINQIAARVKSINTAINRIELGEFGWCDDCGDQIPMARLKTKPDAIRCVDCQHDHEVLAIHYRGAA